MPPLGKRNSFMHETASHPDAEDNQRHHHRDAPQLSSPTMKVGEDGHLKSVVGSGRFAFLGVHRIRYIESIASGKIRNQ